MHPNVFFVVFLLYNVCVYIYMHFCTCVRACLFSFLVGLVWFGLVVCCFVWFGFGWLHMVAWLVVDVLFHLGGRLTSTSNN